MGGQHDYKDCSDLLGAFHLLGGAVLGDHTGNGPTVLAADEDRLPIWEQRRPTKDQHTDPANATKKACNQPDKVQLGPLSQLGQLGDVGRDP